MTTPKAPDEIANILAQRYEMLDALTNGPATQAELGRQVGVSRPTAHRVLTTFQELELVQQHDEQYELTAFGRKLVEQHAKYLESIDRLCQLQTVQRQFSDDISLDTPILEDADAVFNDPYAFDAASYENKALIENSVRVYSIFDGISSNYLDVHLGDTLHEKVVWIVPDAHADTLVDTYEDLLLDLLETEFFELYKTSKPVNYTVTIAEAPDESHAILIAHSNGQVVASARNNSPDAVRWAKNRVDEYLADAERIQIERS